MKRPPQVAVSPLLALLFLFGTLAIIAIVAMVTSDRYDLRIKSGEHELQLRPAGSGAQPPQTERGR